MIDEMHKRLMAWARWRVMGDRVLMARPSIYFLGQRIVDAESSRAACVPVADLECAKVDRAVHALEPETRRIVIEFYCRTQTMAQLQVRLGVSEKTIYRRLDDAHRQVMGLLADMREGRRVLSWRDQQRVASRPVAQVA